MRVKLGTLGGLVVTGAFYLLMYDRTSLELGEMMWPDELYTVSVIQYALLTTFIVSVLVLVTSQSKLTVENESSEFQLVFVMSSIPFIVTIVTAVVVGVYAGFGDVPSSFGLSIIGYISIGIFISGITIFTGSIVGLVLSTITLTGSFAGMVFVEGLVKAYAWKYDSKR